MKKMETTEFSVIVLSNNVSQSVSQSVKVAVFCVLTGGLRSPIPDLVMQDTIITQSHAMFL